jgi:hypothetical protein
MNTATAAAGTPETFLTKRRLVWAGAAAVGGCAVVCSLPILSAVVLGGGAAATAIASFAGPGAELVVGGIAFVIALGLMAVHATSKKVVKEPGASAPRGVIPIACDPLVFSKDQRTEHHERSRNVIVRWPTRKEALEDGYLFHYQGSEERFLAIAQWASSEHRCCSWASFSIEMDPFSNDEPGAIRLRMRGGAEGKALLMDAFTLLEGDELPTETPIACTPNGVPAELQARWFEAGKELYASVEELQELPDGYACRLPLGSATLARAAEYVSLDRLCCTFVTWHLRAEPDAGPVWLWITGPRGTKELMRSCFESMNLIREPVLAAAGLKATARQMPELAQQLQQT